MYQGVCGVTESRGIIVFCFSLLCMVVFGDAFGQAWTQPQGNIYTKLSFGHAIASRQFQFDGSSKDFFDGVDKGIVFQDSSFYLYTEAGLLDYLTLTFSLPYKRIFLEDNTFNYFTSAIGDIGGGVRFDLQHFMNLPKITALALNVSATFPTGYTRNFLPTAGLGQTQLQFFVNYGQNFHPYPLYAQFALGYQSRLPFFYATKTVECSSNEPGCVPAPQEIEASHEIAFSMELGATPLKWLLIQLLFNGVVSVLSPEAGVPPPSTPEPRQRFLKAGGALTFYPFFNIPSMARLGLGAQVLTTFWGQKSNQAYEFLFGVEYQINVKKIGN